MKLLEHQEFLWGQAENLHRSSVKLKYEQEMLQRCALIGSNDWLKHSILHHVVTKEIISVRTKSHSGSSNISEVTLKRL